MENILRTHQIQPNTLDFAGKEKHRNKGFSRHSTSSVGQSSSSSSSLSLLLRNHVRLFYRRWAHFVVAHPLKIVLFCFVLTAICATKMAKTKHKNDIRGYTPYGARALHEFDVRDEFFDQTGTGIRFFVLIVPRNNATKNMLSVDTLRETVEVDNFIQHNLTIFNRLTQRDEPFSRICRRFCTINEPVQLFYVGFRDQAERSVRGEPPNHRVLLNYPNSEIFGRQMNIQPNFFGVHFHNKTGTGVTGNMASAEMVVLLYRAERIGGWSDEDIHEYEMNVHRYFKSNQFGEHIRVLTISTSYAREEIDRAGEVLRSYVAIGLCVMMLCSVLSNSASAHFMRQFSLRRLPVAVFACLCPFMASATALGLLFFAGVRNGSILGVTPFLILAIGVDDAFLMMHSWQLATRRRCKAQPQHQSVDVLIADQLAEVLEDTGPAILISALTNICADLVGSFTGSPEITLLCIGNIASILVDFFYQITLFTAVLVLCVRWELNANAKQSSNSGKAVQTVTHQRDLERTNDDGASASSPATTGVRCALERAFHFGVERYVRLVTNVFVASCICLFWTVTLVACFSALLTFDINLTTKKLFAPDSPLLEIENYREEKVLPFYTTAQLFVNNPGDLGNATRRRHLDALINDMEHLKYAYPSESSLYFVRTYEEFESFVQENEADAESENTAKLEKGNEGDGAERKFDFADLETFLNWPEYRHWRGLIKYHSEGRDDSGISNSSDGAVHLDSLMATVAYHGDALKDWHQRALMLRDWRVVVDKYAAEFNVSVLHDDGLYLDLLENMPTDIWQSALATLLCMAAICALFMNNLFVVAVTTVVIASIFIDTLGIMALIGMAMDPVVMAAVIISIGFSVDIPAHVAYHFNEAKRGQGTRDGEKSSSDGGVRVEQCVRHAFHSVGFPALQASTCTNICVLVLLIVPLHTAQVFVRVLCVCIALCTVHSLCLLPALFSVLAGVERLLSAIAMRSTQK